MNWNKALNVLILIFIGVNVILAGANYEKNISIYKLSPKRIENVVKVFNEENITINAMLPTDFRPCKSLWTEPFQMTSEIRDQIVGSFFGKDKDRVMISQIASNMAYEKMKRVYKLDTKSLMFGENNLFYQDESIALKEGNLSKSEAEKMAKSFLRQIGQDKKFKNAKSEYRSESYGAVVTYYEVYEGIPLFDSFAVFQITPEGVATFYEQNVKVVESSSEVTPLYPIDKVLYGLQDEEVFGETVTIEDISLGYGMENSEGMHILKEEAVPMYKIVLSGLDEPIFVNAYTNVVVDREVGYFY